MATVKKLDPYNLDVKFEQVVVTLTCSNSRFYGRVGIHLDPELLRTEASKAAVRAAQAIARDVGHGPTNSMIVIQRLRTWMDDGKMKLEVIKKVVEMFDDVEDAGLPDTDDVIKELAPILQQRVRDAAVQEGIAAFSRKGDLSKVIELEHKASRIGVTDTSVGTALGSESWEEVESLQGIERLPTGIVELDTAIDGGLQRGGLGVLIGGTGDGKSMGLSHIAGNSLRNGAFVGYVTLELPRAEVLARVKANVTSVPINMLKAGDTSSARSRMAALMASGKFGHLIVQNFTPLATTVDDIREWVKHCEDHAKAKMDLLIVDYGDKVGVKKGKGKEDESGYTTGRVVYESLRIWAEERNTFCWTASQGTRRKDRKKRLDVDDVADSMHKVRVADLIVTLNVFETDQDRQIKLFVAKHRTGASRMELGPFPTAYEVGQVVPI